MVDLTPQTGKVAVLQRLSDRVTAEATVVKAIELLTAVGCWRVPISTLAAVPGNSSSSSIISSVGGSFSDPSVFGLSSFVVRDLVIVQSIVAGLQRDLRPLPQQHVRPHYPTLCGPSLFTHV